MTSPSLAYGYPLRNGSFIGNFRHLTEFHYMLSVLGAPPPGLMIDPAPSSFGCSSTQIQVREQLKLEKERIFEDQRGSAVPTGENTPI